MPRGIPNKKKVVEEVTKTVSETPASVLEVKYYPQIVQIFNKQGILVLRYQVNSEQEEEQARANAQRRGYDIVIR